VLVHTFGLRQGSGGTGKYRGGEGVIRELEFLEPLQVSILSEVLDFVLISVQKANPFS
jgi:5-oxoprolinase (ATP-hydrolysing)